MLNIFAMFDPFYSEYGGMNERRELGEVIRTVILTVAMVILGLVALFFLVAINYVMLMCALKLLDQICASCRYRAMNNSQPPSYDSLCNYNKSYYYLRFLHRFFLNRD